MARRAEQGVPVRFQRKLLFADDTPAVAIDLNKIYKEAMHEAGIHHYINVVHHDSGMLQFFVSCLSAEEIESLLLAVIAQLKGGARP